jgi:hypothetical protein
VSLLSTWTVKTALVAGGSFYPWNYDEDKKFAEENKS